MSYKVKIRYVHGWQPSDEEEPDETTEQCAVVMGPILDGGIVIGWEAEGVGFGELTLVSKDGKLEADTEGMGKVFTDAIFVALANAFEVKDE